MSGVGSVSYRWQPAYLDFALYILCLASIHAAQVLVVVVAVAANKELIDQKV